VVEQWFGVGVFRGAPKREVHQVVSDAIADRQFQIPPKKVERREFLAPGERRGKG
jgi:hypothetical protein